jgi:hypothetical protein
VNQNPSSPKLSRNLHVVQASASFVAERLQGDVVIDVAIFLGAPFESIHIRCDPFEGLSHANLRIFNDFVLGRKP